MLANTFDPSLPDWHVGYGGTDGNGNPIYPYTDYLLVKMGASGNVQWQRCYGGSNDEVANDLLITSDGGYLLVGSSGSNNDGDVTGHHGQAFKRDYWIVKTNASGDIQWQKSYGSDAGHEYAYSAQETTDGGYVVAGTTDHDHQDVGGFIGSTDYWVIKLDNSGNLTWQKCLGGSDGDYASSIVQADDGGYVVVGSSRSHDVHVTGHHGNWGDITGGTSDLWAVKLNATGTGIEWQRSLGGVADEHAACIRKTADGGFIIAGDALSSGGDVSGIHSTSSSDAWVVKLSAAGEIEWQKCLGGTFTEQSFSLEVTSDGGYVIAGATMSNDGDVTGNNSQQYDWGGYGFDGWIVRLNATGDVQWQKCLGGNTGEQMHYVAQTDDGFVAVGRTDSNDGDVYGNHGSWDYWVVKLGPETTGIAALDQEVSVEVYPNPAKGSVTISNVPRGATVAISDLAGKTAYRSVIRDEQATINTADLVAGVYMVRIEKNGAVASRKLLIGE